jgi:hypothetical protein
MSAWRGMCVALSLSRAYVLCFFSRGMQPVRPGRVATRAAISGGIRLVLFPAPGSRVTAAASPGPSKATHTRGPHRRTGHIRCGTGGHIGERRWRPAPYAHRLSHGQPIGKASRRLSSDSIVSFFRLLAGGPRGGMTRIARITGRDSVPSIGRCHRSREFDKSHARPRSSPDRQDHFSRQIIMRSTSRQVGRRARRPLQVDTTRLQVRVKAVCLPPPRYRTVRKEIEIMRRAVTCTMHSWIRVMEFQL